MRFGGFGDELEEIDRNIEKARAKGYEEGVLHGLRLALRIWTTHRSDTPWYIQERIRAAIQRRKEASK